VGELMMNLWREHHVGESVILGERHQSTSHTSKPPRATEGAMA
jgi:hypothetical protein